MSIPTQPYTAEDLAAVKEVNRKRFLESCERRETGAQRKAGSARRNGRSGRTTGTCISWVLAAPPIN